MLINKPDCLRISLLPELLTTTGQTQILLSVNCSLTRIVTTMFLQQEKRFQWLYYFHVVWRTTWNFIPTHANICVVDLLPGSLEISEYSKMKQCHIWVSADFQLTMRLQTTKTTGPLNKPLFHPRTGWQQQWSGCDQTYLLVLLQCFQFNYGIRTAC